jgi:hypothetical protein
MLPPRINEVRDVAVLASDVWVAGRAGMTGVLFRRSGSAWREVARLRSVSGRAAALVHIAAAGSSVIAVGSDGRRAVIVFASGRGEVRRTLRPRGLDNGTAIAAASGGILVTGYRAPGGVVENATGILLRTTVQGGRIARRAFEETTQLLDVSFRSRRTAYVLASTGRGDIAWKSSTGGRSWTKLRGVQGLTVESLVEGGSFYAVGGSGLVRVP